MAGCHFDTLITFQETCFFSAFVCAIAFKAFVSTLISSSYLFSGTYEALAFLTFTCLQVVQIENRSSSLIRWKHKRSSAKSAFHERQNEVNVLEFTTNQADSYIALMRNIQSFHRMHGLKLQLLFLFQISLFHITSRSKGRAFVILIIEWSNLLLLELMQTCLVTKRTFCKKFWLK